MRYKSEFGRKHLYTIQTHTEKSDKHQAAERHQGQALFAEGVTFAKLASLIAQGASIKSTQLTKSFDFKSYTVKNQGQITPLFALDPRGNLYFFTPESNFEPKEDWNVVSLVQNLT